jgi:hypothetical protein
LSLDHVAAGRVDESARCIRRVIEINERASGSMREVLGLRVLARETATSRHGSGAEPEARPG